MSFSYWNRIPNFRQQIAIDWSGAKSPIKSRNIAVASCKDNILSLEKGPWSRQDVADLIIAESRKEGMSMVGIDANFSYQVDALEKICGTKAAAKDLWSKIEAITKGHKNFFAGNVWQESEFKSLYWTEGKQPQGFNPYHRQTEFSAREKWKARPESTFKLIGAKQVGKGGLAAMLVYLYLKEKLGDKVSLWPFEKPTGQTKIVLFEIFPRLFIQKYALSSQKIRDINILKENLPIKIELSSSVSDHEGDALISAFGLMEAAKDVSVWHPKQLSETTAITEGWIFGA